MADRETTKVMKSVKAGKPLRSRGFLSQPGGGTVESGDASRAEGNGGRPNKSRGQRQPVVSGDGKPEGLTTKVSVRPYTLEIK